MVEKVRNTLIKFHMVEPKEHILVGLSGGADSVCLLYVLNALKDEFGFTLQAVHVHHGLRGEDADLDALFSQKFCEGLGIECHVVHRNVQEEAKGLKISVEEAGRRARYESFDAIRANLGSCKIAVAHHMNDQAETVLFNFMRGSGLKGLGGMKPVRNEIIRPLMECKRTEIEAFCEGVPLAYRTDLSNEMNVYTRNKIRNELIPYIEKNFNGSFVSQMGQMSELLRDDMTFLEEAAQKYYVMVLKQVTGTQVILDAQRLQELHPAMRKRIFMLAIGAICKNLQGYESKHLAMLDSFIFMGTGKKLSLLNHLTVEKVYQEVRFSLEEPTEEEKGSFWEYILPKVDTIVEMKEIDAQLQIRVLEGENPIKFGENRYTKWFDYDKIICDLKVRNRRDGDFIYLKGTKLKKKLKDYFIDQKIPRDKRGLTPLITDGSNVLWIIGYRMNDAFKVSSDTKKILEVKFLSEEQANDNRG